MKNFIVPLFAISLVALVIVTLKVIGINEWSHNVDCNNYSHQLDFYEDCMARTDCRVTAYEYNQYQMFLKAYHAEQCERTKP